MLQRSTIQFIRELQLNNNREWFHQNKLLYDKSRKDFELLVADIINGIASFDPPIGYLDPKKCIFRIYRDVRFSADKSPYKNHFGAVFRPAPLEKTSGYYIHIGADESFLTCGHYMLSPEQLKKIRKGIYNDYETLSSILNEEKFKKEIGDFYVDEDVLKRVPNGFDKNHPAAGYLKLKHFYVLKPLAEKEILSGNFVEYAVSVYKKMHPLGVFLNDLLLD